MNAATGTLRIRPFEEADIEVVIAMWRRCDLVRPYLAVNPDHQRRGYAPC